MSSTLQRTPDIISGEYWLRCIVGCRGRYRLCNKKRIRDRQKNVPLLTGWTPPHMVYRDYNPECTTRYQIQCNHQRELIPPWPKWVSANGIILLDGYWRLVNWVNCVQVIPHGKESYDMNENPQLFHLSTYFGPNSKCIFTYHDLSEMFRGLMHAML